MIDQIFDAQNRKAWKEEKIRRREARFMRKKTQFYAEADLKQAVQNLTRNEREVHRERVVRKIKKRDEKRKRLDEEAPAPHEIQVTEVKVKKPNQLPQKILHSIELQTEKAIRSKKLKPKP